MYKNLNVKVKWNNGISENVEVKQGIRQGEKNSQQSCIKDTITTY